MITFMQRLELLLHEGETASLLAACTWQTADEFVLTRRQMFLFSVTQKLGHIPALFAFGSEDEDLRGSK